MSREMQEADSIQGTLLKAANDMSAEVSGGLPVVKEPHSMECCSNGVCVVTWKPAKQFVA